MKKYIIIGLTPQGLSVLRTISREGAEVYAFCNTKNNVGYYSKYGKKIVFNNINELRNEIKKIVSISNEKPVCYVTSGEMLAWILTEFTDLYDLCEVSSGPLATLQILAHKDKMYEYAEQRGFKVARYVTLDKLEADKVTFPAFMKRNYEIPLFFKAEKIDNRQMLDSFLGRITAEQRKDIILQEFIECADLLEISCQALFFNGKCAGTLITNQKRRLKKGLTAMVEELDSSEIKSKIDSLCRSFFSETKNGDKPLSYNGLIEFEFMYDKQSDDLWFVEVNTRSCGLQSSFAAKYSNMGKALLNPHKFTELQPAVEHLKWMNIMRDVKARIQNKNLSNLTDIFTAAYDILDFHDPKPFIMRILPK